MPLPASTSQTPSNGGISRHKLTPHERRQERRERTRIFDLARYLERPVLARGSIKAIAETLQMLQDEGYDAEQAYHSARRMTPEWPDQPHPKYEDVRPTPELVAAAVELVVDYVKQPGSLRNFRDFAQRIAAAIGRDVTLELDEYRRDAWNRVRTRFADAKQLGRDVPNTSLDDGTGDFDEFLDWLARWIGAPIVSDVDVLPANQISWHMHQRSPSTGETREEDHDPKLVLPNITAQTGLEFDLGVRPIEILFIESRQDSADAVKEQ